MGSDHSKEDFRQARIYLESSQNDRQSYNRIRDGQFKKYVDLFANYRSERKHFNENTLSWNSQIFRLQEKIKQLTAESQNNQIEADRWAKSLWNCVKCFDAAKSEAPTSQFQSLIMKRFELLQAEIKTRDKVLLKTIRIISGDQNYALDYRNMHILAQSLKAEVEKGRKQASVIMRDVFVYNETQEQQVKQALQQKERELEKTKPKIENFRRETQKMINQFGASLSSEQLSSWNEVAKEERQNSEIKNSAIQTLIGKNECQELAFRSSKESFCQSFLKDQSEIKFLLDILKKQGTISPFGKLVYQLHPSEKESYLKFIKQKKIFSSYLKLILHSPLQSTSRKKSSKKQGCSHSRGKKNFNQSKVDHRSVAKKMKSSLETMSSEQVFMTEKCQPNSRRQTPSFEKREIKNKS